MKKIFNILFAVSLLSVACTKEVPVTRDHDINAEVVEMQTKEEISTLYCNLTEATEALMALGYDRSTVIKALGGIDPTLDVGMIIKAALKKLAR